MKAAATPGAGTHPATATDRLQRLLALVPYVVSRKVVGLAETAATFGVTEQRAGRRPEHAVVRRAAVTRPVLPDRPVLRGRRDRWSARPSRSTGRCGSAWTRRARCWSRCGCWPSCPALEDRSALRRTIAKLEAAAGAAGAASAQVAVQVDDRAPAGVLARSRDALAAAAGGCTCPTTCRAGTRPPSGTRTRCGCWWSTAGPTWRPGAAGPRRSGCSGWTGCSASTVLDLPAAVPDEAQPRDLDSGLFRPSAGDVQVVLELAPLAAGSPSTTRARRSADLGDGQAAGQPAHAGHPVGQAARAAARRGRPGDRAGRARRPRCARTPRPRWRSTH